LQNRIYTALKDAGASSCSKPEELKELEWGAFAGERLGAGSEPLVNAFRMQPWVLTGIFLLMPRISFSLICVFVLPNF